MWNMFSYDYAYITEKGFKMKPAREYDIMPTVFDAPIQLDQSTKTFKSNPNTDFNFLTTSNRTV